MFVLLNFGRQGQGRPLWRSALRTCISCLGLAGIALGAEGSAQPHRFSVRDSIEMTRFSDPSDFERESKARLSPDGNYFLVITSRGLMESNRIESTLWIFSKDDVRSFLTAPSAAAWLSPRTLATVAAVPIADAVATYSPVISSARWSPMCIFWARVVSSSGVIIDILLISCKYFSTACESLLVIWVAIFNCLIEIL